MTRIKSSYLLYIIKDHHIAYVPIESKAKRTEEQVHEGNARSYVMVDNKC